MNALPHAGYAYFVHSYYCVPANESDVLAVVDYGVRFTAAVEHENIWGVQFHPEKSQETGLRLLTNFLEIDLS
jgi:glutamine amidotransferase